MSPRILLHVGGIYADIHERIFGAKSRTEPVQIGGLTPALVEAARKAWQGRLRREYRALQQASRLLTEVVGAGDPLEVYGSVLAVLNYKVRRVGLCVSGCEMYGAAPVLPSIEPDEPWPSADAPMLERAVATVLSSLAIEDTIRRRFTQDLRARCSVRRMCDALDELLVDGEARERFAWTYAHDGVRRLPPSHLTEWRHLVEITLSPYEKQAEAALANVPEERRTLDAFPEPELADLGIFSEQRQALLYRRILKDDLTPRLRELELL